MEADFSIHAVVWQVMEGIAALWVIGALARIFLMGGMSDTITLFAKAFCG